MCSPGVMQQCISPACTYLFRMQHSSVGACLGRSSVHLATRWSMHLTLPRWSVGTSGDTNAQAIPGTNAQTNHRHANQPQTLKLPLAPMLQRGSPTPDAPASNCNTLERECTAGQYHCLEQDEPSHCSCAFFLLIASVFPKESLLSRRQVTYLRGTQKKTTKETTLRL